jgi:hypothetical protein
VLDDTLFADFANTTYLNYCRQKNANYKAKGALRPHPRRRIWDNAAARYHASDAPRSAVEIASPKTRER